MTEENQREESNEEAIASRPMKEGQTGESGGGPYPRQGGEAGTGDFKGGQSDHAYYGKGQLGDDKLGDTENAPSTEE